MTGRNKLVVNKATLMKMLETDLNVNALKPDVTVTDFSKIRGGSRSGISYEIEFEAKSEKAECPD